MEHLALYRKYRPKTFEDVVGQEYIIKGLVNQIKMGKVGHAYLFCGARGTGKTTTARLLAKAVNCLSDNKPCSECESCIGIEKGIITSVIEIDAASNNGVDDIRNIREELNYPPSDGKYKVYIIDEVHMLSDSARNALLKTLEEPYPYVIFILATTEPNKLTPTILSRCQRYDFRLLSVHDIKNELKRICDLEGFKIDEDGLYYISGLGKGSLRDALSILEMVSIYAIDDELSKKELLGILGAIDDDYYKEMLWALVNCDIENGLRILLEKNSLGIEYKSILKSMISYLRDLVMVNALKEYDEKLNMTQESWMDKKDILEKCDFNSILYILRLLSEGLEELKFSFDESISIELLFIKILSRKNKLFVEKDSNNTFVDNNLNTIKKAEEKNKPKIKEENYSNNTNIGNTSDDDAYYNMLTNNYNLGYNENSVSDFESSNSGSKKGNTLFDNKDKTCEDFSDGKEIDSIQKAASKTGDEKNRFLSVLDPFFKGIFIKTDFKIDVEKKSLIVYTDNAFIKNAFKHPVKAKTFKLLLEKAGMSEYSLIINEKNIDGSNASNDAHASKVREILLAKARIDDKIEFVEE